MKILARWLVVFLAVCGTAPNARAEEAKQRPDLALATLEDLLTIKITSASRKEQQADNVPAAVFVITQEDIRQSGTAALAEVLRRAPGVQITRQNSGTWALTVRGFNGSLANKLLVLIDGRSIYNRGNSGVFWASEDLLLDDIERIEVIRGPGGAIWGANAVNGVINIVTKSAADTTGVLVRVGDSMFDGQQVAMRIGRARGNTAYRVSSQWSQHDSSRLAPGISAHDSWNMFSTAGRVDWQKDQNAFLSEATFTKSDSRPLSAEITGPTDFQPTTQSQWNWLRGSMLSRWTHTYAGGGSFELRTFYNFNQNNHTPAAVHFIDIEHIADVDLALHVGLGQRHDLVVGGGYRHLVNTTTSSIFGFSVLPNRDGADVVNAFAQDDIAVGERLQLTLGAKLERETIPGWNVQPTARAMWTIGPANQRIWAAFSRAIRAPSPYNRNITVRFVATPGQDGLPVVFGLLGNPTYESERFRDLEAGYRATVGPHVTLDITAFRGHYDKLPTTEPVAPRVDATTGTPFVFVPVQLNNLMSADTTGAEIVVRWMPAKTLSVDGSYSHFRLAASVDPSSHDVTSAPEAEDVPAHQWQLHSAYTPGRIVEVSGALFYVSELHSAHVPAYTRADARLALKLSKQLSAVVSGQNLLHETHAEASDDGKVVGTLVPRSAGVQLVWGF